MTISNAFKYARHLPHTPKLLHGRHTSNNREGLMCPQREACNSTQRNNINLPQSMLHLNQQQIDTDVHTLNTDNIQMHESELTAGNREAYTEVQQVRK